jgi:hypothetical protein
MKIDSNYNLVSTLNLNRFPFVRNTSDQVEKMELHQEEEEAVLQAKLDAAQTYEERAEIRALLRALKKDKTSVPSATKSPANPSRTAAQTKTTSTTSSQSATSASKTPAAAVTPKAAETVSQIHHQAKTSSEKATRALSSTAPSTAQEQPAFGKHMLKHTTPTAPTDTKPTPSAQLPFVQLKHATREQPSVQQNTSRKAQSVSSERTELRKPAIAVPGGSDDEVYLSWLSNVCFMQSAAEGQKATKELWLLL